MTSIVYEYYILFAYHARHRQSIVSPWMSPCLPMTMETNAVPAAVLCVIQIYSNPVKMFAVVTLASRVLGFEHDGSLRWHLRQCKMSCVHRTLSAGPHSLHERLALTIVSGYTKKDAFERTLRIPTSNKLKSLAEDLLSRCGPHPTSIHLRF